MTPAEACALLGVATGASMDELRSAHRARARESHPDRLSHLGPVLRAAAEEQMKLINAAYDLLRHGPTPPEPSPPTRSPPRSPPRPPCAAPSRAPPPPAAPAMPRTPDWTGQQIALFIWLLLSALLWVLSLLGGASSHL